jgi:virulence factor Mce-like protein
MLTRFVRIQLAIFTIASIVGVSALVFVYVQVPMLLGIGRIIVTLELPGTGGLYHLSNVTYRGVQIGKVTGVAATREGAKATLSLDTSPRVPADLQAEVRSVSAVGEQYVDLRPRTSGAPYLRDGSVIAMRDTTIPQPVGPMLDRVSALVHSIPKDRLSGLMDESFRAFNGAGYDMGSLIDSSATISGDINSVRDRTRALIDDSGPLLASQAETADAIRTWTRSLADVTEQVRTDDAQVRTVLQAGPGAAQEVARLLDQVKPTLPVLLANLTTVGQIAVTYHASLEQVLVLLPPFAAVIQSLVGNKNPTGMAESDFSITVNDPPACTVGFLPPSQWRSPADTTTIDTPDGLYCKLPQDSPIAVRGARNYPCMGHPGKRAPTVEICNSDKPFEPLAMRQHIFGTYPLDPNLLAQGIPPDDRVGFYRDRIFGPVEGTPRPPGPLPPAGPLPPPRAPAGAPNPAPPPAANAPQAEPPGLPPIAPIDVPDAPSPPAGPAGGGTHAAPSSFGGNDFRPGPSLAVVHYDPRTGGYVGPDRQLYQQSNLVSSSAPKTWQDMLPT